MEATTRSSHCYAGLQFVQCGWSLALASAHTILSSASEFLSMLLLKSWTAATSSNNDGAIILIVSRRYGARETNKKKQNFYFVHNCVDSSALTWTVEHSEAHWAGEKISWRQSGEITRSSHRAILGVTAENMSSSEATKNSFNFRSVINELKIHCPIYGRQNEIHHISWMGQAKMSKQRKLDFLLLEIVEKHKRKRRKDDKSNKKQSWRR